MVAFILRCAFLQLATCNQSSVASCRLRVAGSLAFLGISIAAIFLHAWEDSAVAWTVWLLVAVALSVVHGMDKRGSTPRIDR
jgi:hypothetical protein